MTEENKTETPKEKKKISYTQYSTYFNCAKKFELDYIKGLRSFEGSIHMCFGTAIHNAVQLYVKTLYTEGAEKADGINLYDVFKESFEKELKTEKYKIKYTTNDFNEFCKDGEDILNTFCKTSNRLKYFPSQKYEFIGSELPLEVDIKNNLQFIAYVDLILKDK